LAGALPERAALLAAAAFRVAFLGFVPLLAFGVVLPFVAVFRDA
jgi:hypothetical protein